MAWFLPDETEPLAEKVLRALASDGEALVPVIWLSEVCNSLVMNERRGRIDKATTDEAIALLQKLPILQTEADPRTAFVDVARRNRLTVYDAAYLCLARQENCALATLDNDLRAACASEGVKLFE